MNVKELKDFIAKVETQRGTAEVEAMLVSVDVNGRGSPTDRDGAPLAAGVTLGASFCIMAK